VRAFVDDYEKGVNTSDPELVGSLYADEFMFGGPQGVRAVLKEDFLRVLTKQSGLFESAGWTASSVESIDETQLDDHYVLLGIGWRMSFEKPPGRRVGVQLATTYVLRQEGPRMRIVLQLDHQDFVKKVADLGLLPS